MSREAGLPMTMSMSSGLSTKRPFASDVRSSNVEYQLVRDDTEDIDAELPLHESQQDSIESWRLATLNVVQSEKVQMLMALAILANALVIGLETDIPDYPYWSLIENIFLFVFTMELVGRVFGLGIAFFDFTNSDFIWNLFDFGIVLLGLVDGVGELFSSGGKKAGGLSTLFRMVRLLRILRIFKIIKFLKQLYLLAYGFIEAAQAVFWVTLLMMFVLYVCSIILVRTVGKNTASDEHSMMLKDKYGTIVKSMLTLFELMSNPDMNPYHGMRGTFPFLTIFLMVFIIFGSFGMIALLTGVISESMFEKNAMKLDSERIDRERRRKELLRRLAEIFESVEVDGYGEASKEAVFAARPAVATLFDELGISYATFDLDQIVELMDIDDSGGITKKEFVQGLLSIAEEIRPMTMAELFHQVTICRTKIEICTDKVGSMRRLSVASHDFSSNSDTMEMIQQEVRSIQQEVRSIAEIQLKGAAEMNILRTLVQHCLQKEDQTGELRSVDEPAVGTRMSFYETTMSEAKDMFHKLSNQVQQLSTNVAELTSSSRQPLLAGLDELDARDVLKVASIDAKVQTLRMASRQVTELYAKNCVNNAPGRQLNTSHSGLAQEGHMEDPRRSAQISTADLTREPILCQHPSADVLEASHVTLHVGASALGDCVVSPAAEDACQN